MELHPTCAEADDVLLTMTEVVTNSVRHGEPPIHVELLDAARSLRMSISDASDELPRQRRFPADSEGGRGMVLVEALSSRWGVARTLRGGKTVWCTFTPQPAAQ